MHVVDKGREVVLRQYHLYLHMLVVIVATYYLVQRAAANELGGDESLQFLIVFRDDVHTCALVDVGHEVVEDEAIEPCSYQTDDDKLHRIDEEGRTADGSPCHCYRRTEVDVQVLVADFGQNVESSRRSVDAEEHALREA